MPRTLWSLRHERPTIELELPGLATRRKRRLIADTGAGDRYSSFQLVLPKSVCERCGGVHIGESTLRGAYSGAFGVYLVEIAIQSIGISDFVPAIGADHVPKGFDGIACFRFLNRFHYGNFGDRDHFGLAK